MSSFRQIFYTCVGCNEIAQPTQNKNELETTMNTMSISACVFLGLLGSSLVLAGDDKSMIASAESAGPSSVTSDATSKAPGPDVTGHHVYSKRHRQCA